MINKIYEEALASALKRIEVLEDKMSRISIPNKEGFYEPVKQAQGFAEVPVTKGQLKYLRLLRGNVSPGMTKVQAGVEIDRILQLNKSNGEHADEENEHAETIEEPKEVETDDIGIDEEGFI